MELRADILGENVRIFGRTFFDKEKNVLFFNWTNAGFEMTFSGNKVEIELEGQADYFPTEGTNLPYIAVIIDGARKPASVLRICEGTNSYTLFESPEKETHTLKVVKRSENSKGRVGIKKLIVSGEILPTDRQPKYRLEFIGDSITCGYGNDMDGMTETFSTALEDGLRTYSAIAADLLDADYHSICISGIPLCASYNKDFRLIPPGFPDLPDFKAPPAMMDYYEYTDRFQQEANDLESGFEKWDFNRFKPDAIIVNLGTNDAFRVKASGNDPEEERHFEKQYKAFLLTLRRLNGTQPLIGCTLGSMDYYLYDNIIRAVEAYQAQTGDKRVFCYKYGGMFLWDEGTGGLGHPSIKTHKRMGKELAEQLKKRL